MHDPLTEKVIGLAYKVHNTLGFGFLEAVYERALSIELAKEGIEHLTQAPIQVFYEGHLVGEYVADIFVQNQLIVELKSVGKLATTHEVQLVNYLTATRTDVGLLINFGPTRVEVRRKFRKCDAQDEGG